MGRALESMGWQVSTGTKTCTECGTPTYDEFSNFCAHCGAKLPKPDKDDSHEQLEAAISYALGESRKMGPP